MQKFTYHTHNNNFGIYDGRSSCEEMLSQAQKLGFEEIGVSNHLCYHRNMKKDSSMFYSDLGAMTELCQRNIEYIRKVSHSFKIKVRIGFEVDYFPSTQWRNDFEKILSSIKYDYLIGATHFLRTENEEEIINLYHLQSHSCPDLESKLHTYWDNVAGAAQSGYFNFIAHLDQPKLFNLCTEESWNIDKKKVIKALIQNQTPFEINTGGITKGLSSPYPDLWIIKELLSHNVPVLISDDAHEVGHIGQHFEYAENLLSELNCKTRLLSL